MRKETLVYSDYIEAGEIADMMEIDPSDSKDDDHNDDMYDKGESLNRKARDAATQEMFDVAMEIRDVKKSPGLDGWPPDSSDLTFDHATESIPVKLFNFIAWTLGYSNEPLLDERVVMSCKKDWNVTDIQKSI